MPAPPVNCPADGCAAATLCRRFAYFRPQSNPCLPFGLTRLRRTHSYALLRQQAKQAGRREACRSPRGAPPTWKEHNTTMSEKKCRDPYPGEPIERGPPPKPPRSPLTRSLRFLLFQGLVVESSQSRAPLSRVSSRCTIVPGSGLACLLIENALFLELREAVDHRLRCLGKARQ